jgi:DUF4097 and DUF4098 domain-containing protein YvlB
MNMRNNRIAKTAVVLTALFLVFGLCGGAAWAKERHEEKFEKTESLAKDGKVIITNVSGKIQVQSWGEAQVKIEAVKISEASSLEKAKENASKVTIEVSKTGNIVQIETKYPDRSFLRGTSLNVSVDYVLWIPDKASIKVKSTSGNVDATGIGGTFEGNITSGNATLLKIAGGVDFKTVSGQIRIEDVPADIDVKTVSGNIEATRIKGSVDAETTSGRITLRDIAEAKSVRAHVLSGRIAYDGQIGAGSKFSLETLSGGIEVLLPANAAFELDAETFSGHVNSDFPITMQGTVSPKELRGVVNNGGASLRLKTFSGTIVIKKK